MKYLFTCLAVSTLLLGACGGDDKETPAPPGSNGDAGSELVADGDAGSDATGDGGIPAAVWKPGDKIPADKMWNSGSDGADPVWEKEFGTWRGRPTTSTWMNLLFLSWQWLEEPGLHSALGDTADTEFYVWDKWKDFQGVIALSMSMAGNSEVTDAEYQDSMRMCALGAWDDHWKAFARNAKAAGRNGNNTIVSLAQEFNGTWFQWNPSVVGMQVWTDCWKHVYNAIHSESDLQVAWVFSSYMTAPELDVLAVPNAWDAYPGDAYVDVIGMTRYNFQDTSKIDTVDWQDTCWNDQDICVTAQRARQHGKKLAVVEWSIQRDETGYGDNPNFVQMMFSFFADNRDVLLLENNFNHYGEEAATLNKWNLYPRADNNAKSSDKYKELYAP